MAASDSKPVPIKGNAFRVYFPIFDDTGDLVSAAAGLDSEVSLDGANFVDCVNEAVEIQSSGMYYLDLTSAEMDADCVVIVVKTSTTDAKTTPIVLYPAPATFSSHSVLDVIAALKAEDSWLTSSGSGSMSFQQIIKVLTAWAIGKVQDKTGESGVYEILDPEDDSTVILEITPSETSPYKDTNVL